MAESNATCSIDGCNKPKLARTWCSHHYNRWHATGDPLPKVADPIECPTCGKRPERTHANGPAPTYCSSACRRAANHAVAVAKSRIKVSTLRGAGAYVCAEESCATTLPGKWTRLCAVHAKARRNAQPRDSQVNTCSEADCDRPVRARNLCTKHYSRVMRTEGRITQQPWNDRRRNNYNRRRALLAGTTDAGSVKLSDIVDRDGLDCALCGNAIDFDIKWPDPFSMSVDHIHPVSRGGRNDLTNSQLAHLRCNISKGAAVNYPPTTATPALIPSM